MCNPKRFSGFTIYIVERKDEKGREGEGERIREGKKHQGKGGRNRWRFQEKQFTSALLHRQE